MLIVDYDAHHGNGTQEIFYADPRVLYVSFHEWPLYPGTGRHDEIGAGAGEGTTRQPARCPAGATGDVYLRALDEVVAPAGRAVRPDVGADLGRLRRATAPTRSPGSGSRPATTRRSATGSPRGPRPGRLISFLEGGYDLGALRDSVAASLPALVGAAGAARSTGEAAHVGGPGHHGGRGGRGPLARAGSTG